MTGSGQNFARTAVRRRPDFGRIAEGLARPGIDPRGWVQMARVDDDPDALRWDAELGWVIDVTCTGPPFDGEPITVRAGAFGQGPGGSAHSPPRAGALVLLGLADGDPSVEAVVLCQMADLEYPAIVTINGDSIVERNAGAGEVSALETHLAGFPSEDLDEEWRNYRIGAGSTGRLWASTLLELAERDADQSYMRGEDYADALGDFLDALGNIVAAINTAINTASGTTAGTVFIDPASLAAFTSARTAFDNARNAYLSTRIKGT